MELPSQAHRGYNIECEHTLRRQTLCFHCLHFRKSHGAVNVADCKRSLFRALLLGRLLQCTYISKSVHPLVGGRVGPCDRSEFFRGSKGPPRRTRPAQVSAYLCSFIIFCLFERARKCACCRAYRQRRGSIHISIDHRTRRRFSNPFCAAVVDESIRENNNIDRDHHFCLFRIQNGTRRRRESSASQYPPPHWA